MIMIIMMIIIITIIAVTIMNMKTRRDCIADMVPVDICINLLVCVAWQTAKEERGAPIKVDLLVMMMMVMMMMVVNHPMFN